MGITIELNDSPSDSLKEAAKKHIDAGAGETLEEAFSRILGGKNISELEKSRIVSVKDALEKGDITRESKAYKANGTLKRLGKAEVMRLYSIIEEREKERTLQQMKDDMPDNYWLVDNEEDIHSMEEALMFEKTIPIDVETTGTDIWSDYIVGYVLSSVTSDIHYYIPTRHDTDEPQLDHDAVTTFLKRLLEKKDALYIGHNIKFDLHMLMNEGINVKGTLWDTQEAQKLLNENEPTYALKNLATKYLDIPSKTYGQLFGKKGFHEVDDLLLATAYAAKDGDVTYKLYEFQRKHLEGRFPSIYKYAVDVEMPLIYAIINMERNGFVIDADRAKEYGNELSQEQFEVRGLIGEVLGEINLNSPAQLKPALESHTGSTLPSTDAKSLESLSKDFPVVKDILRYKELGKLLGTYVEKLPRAISKDTGRLMGSWKQNGAKTGRFSSGGDAGNFQNIPPAAQSLFLAPPGKVWIEADFKAQEIRCVAYLSQEPVLIEAFENERDPYATMASQFFKRPYDEVYKKPDGSDTPERKQMKVVWLATIYGMSSFSLAEMLGMQKKDAERFQSELFESMPKLNAWIEDAKRFVQRNGFVWMDGNKRKRRLPEAQQRRYDIPYGKYYSDEFKDQRLHNSSISRSLRQAPNAVVQGSSSIQTKATMVAADAVCKEREGWAIANAIHDALFWEVPEDFTEEDAELIRQTMVETYPWGDTVANGTDLEVHRVWGDSVSIKDWFERKIDD